MRCQRYAWYLAGLWTIAVAGSLMWNLHHEKEQTLAMARAEAQIAYNKDLVYRHWNASHGGVHVPVTDQTPPNPYIDVPMTPLWALARQHTLAVSAGHGLWWLLGLAGLALGRRHLGQRIREHDRAEEALRDSEAQVRLLLNSTAEAIYGLDLQGNCTFCNPSCLRLLGHQAESELLGKNMHALIHHTRPDGTHYAMEECRIYHAFRQGEGTHVDDEVLWRADGSSFPAEYWSYPMRQGDEVIGSVVTFLDITERKAVEDRNRRLGLAVNSVAEAIILTDREERIIQVNPAFCRITGYTAEEALGQTPHVIRSGKHPPEFYQAMWKTINAGQVWSGRVINKRKDGSFFHAALTIAPIMDEHGEATGYVGVQRDVTEAIKRERALAAALHRIEAADRAKGKFLVNMSDEMRTPLNSILGFTSLLMEEGDQGSETERAEWLSIIQSSGERLLSIINDIVDLSQIEIGNIDVEMIRCSPSSIIQRIHDKLQPHAAAKGLRFGTYYNGPIPEAILTDPSKFQQLLGNLVENAVKFTSKGQVRICVGMKEQAGKPALTIDVEDTGPGIPPEKLETIFEPFSQGSGSARKASDGTGLGLTISRLIVQSLNGSISATSEVGKGSIFSLTLPMGSLEGVEMVLVSDQEDSPDAPASTGDDSCEPRLADKPGESSALDGRVLLVDDDDDTREFMSRILKKAGADVIVAENGRVAVDKVLAAHDSGEPFEAVLMDLYMPVMDGITATRKLREHGMDVPVIAMTSADLSEDGMKCLEAGCTDCLSKPVNPPEVLVGAVARVLKVKEVRPDASASPAGGRELFQKEQSSAPPVGGPDPNADAKVDEGLDPGRLNEMLDAWRRRDFTTLALLARWLSGDEGVEAGLSALQGTAARLVELLTSEPMEQMDEIQEAMDELTSLAGRAFAPVKPHKPDQTG